MDRTLILVKPDAFERGLTGEVIARFERKGLRIAALKLMQIDRELADGTTPSTPRSRSSASWWTSSPAARWSRWCSRARGGEGGPPGDRRDQPVEAAPGSIRGDYAIEVDVQPGPRLGFGGVAEREIGLFFPEL